MKVLQSMDKNSFAKLKKVAKVVRKVAAAIATPQEKNSPVFWATQVSASWLEKEPPWKKTPGFLKALFLAPLAETLRLAPAPITEA